MLKQLPKINTLNSVSLKISGSKSESNRLLILQKLIPELFIENLSNAEDTQVLIKALDKSNGEVNIGHAGTAMRFLTAYFASKKDCAVVLTGSERMKNRPIKILVDALRNLGANIQYLEKEGFPPLKIEGKAISKNEINLAGNVSSQYISALLLIIPQLKNGLKINFTTTITSIPYLKMTLGLLAKLGVNYHWDKNSIQIFNNLKLKNNHFVVESDWSSASYFYSFVSLSKDAKLNMTTFYKDSLQGDSDLVNIYQKLGVQSSFNNGKLSIEKIPDFKKPTTISFNLVNTPDLAQTVAVSCFGLGINCELSGLHTLKIKETDRLVALKTELEKLGAEVTITNHSLSLNCTHKINEKIQIETYQDHRMAMAFAPLSLKVPIGIKNPEVVRKSYPNFWKDLEKLTS
ncbi:MAG: 3-phosphoshikimate 1-carboxyvinyltransferase [Lutibacter sp.]